MFGIYASRIAFVSVFRTLFLSALHIGPISFDFGPSPVIRWMTVSVGSIFKDVTA